MHSQTSLLKIIDLAPIILGIFSFLLGLNVDRRLKSEMETLEILSQKAALQKELAEKLQIQNDELRELNSTLDGMVYTASHDLKTPVINFESMLKMLRMVKDQPNNEKMMEDIIVRMEAATVRFQNTIGDLLEVSRVEKEESKFEPISLSASISEIITSLQEYIADHNANIELDLQQDLVLGMASGITSIFQNLLTNAIKYKAEGRDPEISISSRKVGEKVEVRVSDNGSGIDLNKQSEKLFKMFTRFHAEGEGTGIGLYIVKRTVVKLGGEIQIESQVGEGTTFTIQFQSA